MRIEGKSALVTGAGRGLGAALAAELAARGARVVLISRSREPLEQVASSIRRAGGQAFAIAADVADKEAVCGIAGSAAALAGPIDILVHNASELGPTPLRLLLDTDCEDLARVLEANLVGPFRLTKAIAGAMALRGGGLVLGITSDAALEPYPRWGAYGVSKAALEHLLRIWGAELAETGVRFLSVDPGEMNTRMYHDAIPGADPSTLRDPADVARAIADLVERAEELPSGARVAASITAGAGVPA